MIACDTSRFTRFYFWPNPQNLCSSQNFLSFLRNRSPLPPPDHAPPFTGTAALCPSSTDGGSPIVGFAHKSRWKRSSCPAHQHTAAHQRTLWSTPAAGTAQLWSRLFLCTLRRPNHSHTPPLILRHQTKPNQTNSDTKKTREHYIKLMRVLASYSLSPLYKPVGQNPFLKGRVFQIFSTLWACCT